MGKGIESEMEIVKRNLEMERGGRRSLKGCLEKEFERELNIRNEKENGRGD